VQRAAAATKYHGLFAEFITTVAWLCKSCHILNAPSRRDCGKCGSSSFVVAQVNLPTSKNPGLTWDLAYLHTTYYITAGWSNPCVTHHIPHTGERKALILPRPEYLAAKCVYVCSFLSCCVRSMWKFTQTSIL
jgi:hypothetical protein